MARKIKKRQSHAPKKQEYFEVHHRKPKSRGGRKVTKHGRENTIDLRISYHRAWHHLFANMSPREIAKLITDVYGDPDYYWVAVPRNKKSPKPRRKRRYCEQCECVILARVPRRCKCEAEKMFQMQEGN